MRSRYGTETANSSTLRPDTSTKAARTSQLGSVGQREAPSRMVHLFCETMMRMREVGLVKDGACPFPVTQGDLAEMTGLSSVHINRTLQELRKWELLSFVRGRLTIHNWDGLVEVAEFRTDYLHIPVAKAA
jgi:CRP-like cAMP-binding protein